MNDAMMYAFNHALTEYETKYCNKQRYVDFIIDLDRCIRSQVSDLLPTDYEYMYKDILCTLVKKFKKSLVLDIYIKDIDYVNYKINVEVKTFSVATGSYKRKYIIDCK